MWSKLARASKTYFVVVVVAVVGDCSEFLVLLGEYSTLEALLAGGSDSLLNKYCFVLATGCYFGILGFHQIYD